MRKLLILSSLILSGCGFTPHLQQAFFPTYPDHPIHDPYQELVIRRSEGLSRMIDFSRDPIGEANGKGPACLTAITLNGQQVAVLDIDQTVHLGLTRGRYLVEARTYSGNCNNFVFSRYVLSPRDNFPFRITIRHI